MSAGSKLSIVLVAALLAVGPGACGDGDDSSPSTTNAASGGQASGGGGATGKGSSDGAGGKSGSGSGDREPGDQGSSDSDDFVPRQHQDSGGGSAQFRVNGGDNSVQEFGSEADDSERDEAAAAVHNFLDARAAEAWDSACSFLSAEVRESLESFSVKAQEAAAGEGKSGGQIDDTSCGGILGRLTNRTALPELRQEAAQADVGSLRVEGDRAFVIYRALRGTIIAIPVTSEAGGWKVAALAGTPLN